MLAALGCEPPSPVPEVQKNYLSVEIGPGQYTCQLLRDDQVVNEQVASGFTPDSTIMRIPVPIQPGTYTASCSCAYGSETFVTTDGAIRQQ